MKNAANQMFCFVTILFGSLLPAGHAISQTIEPDEIRSLVRAFKTDPRGPYQAIRWFCPDGSVIPAKQRCPQPGGIQHALPKDIVQRIADEQRIYLGQILAGTPFDDFLDRAHQNSRLKQYQMEKYLHAVDNGWIARRSRFYRGAVQAEDEEAWGFAFLKSLVSSDAMLASQYFLIRQACNDIPHYADDNRWQTIRALSKVIADSVGSFMDIRVKLHGQPDPSDLQMVIGFKERHGRTLPSQINVMIDSLITELRGAQETDNAETLNNLIEKLPGGSPLGPQLKTFVRNYSRKTEAMIMVGEASSLVLNIRKNILSHRSPADRLVLFDLSNFLERILFQEVSKWTPRTRSELMIKNYRLAEAAAGSGFLELWEWDAVEPFLTLDPATQRVSAEKFIEHATYSRSVVEWGTGMVHSVYGPVVTLFSPFEPLASGFIDDRIRSSVLLPLGDAAAELGDAVSLLSGVSNDVLSIRNQSQIRGLNPGFALGELEVIAGPPGNISFSSKKIYVLANAPPDIKPVAGIATVSGGNLVSHVQLLARNLGIPNAVISQQNLVELTSFSGQRIFFAVSPRGTVIMKPESRMTPQEKALVEERRRTEERISVSTDNIDLGHLHLTSLRGLRSSDSGRLCGPKAANLAQLKSLFPEKVVEGFIIPFGVFRRHLDQPMPGIPDRSYWQFLQDIFVRADLERKSGKTEEDAERAILERLSKLREAIARIPLLKDFEEDLSERFVEEFGVRIGQLPVFIRSDTNMEDLKDFTGAGLNLTVFNVMEEKKILQAVRDVWASPFTERSYRWRQKFLVNPENVYPSILILPSINVDKSGVMITTGISSGDPSDVTVAFSRGVGGAVEGQQTESYLLRKDGTGLLLSPSREIEFTALGSTGGSSRVPAYLNKPILGPEELALLRATAGELKKRLRGPQGIDEPGPFDVELGFTGNSIWLFQVRPYVENKRARSSEYLRSLDPGVPRTGDVFLQGEL